MAKQLGVMLFLIAILWIPLVSANINIQQSSIDFGSNDQEKQLNNAPISLSQNITVDFTDLAYSNVGFTFTPANGFPSGNVNVDGLATSYANATASINVSLTIPEDFDAVDEELDEKRFDIGTVSISGQDGSTTDSDSLDISLEIKNGIQIVKVELIKPDGSISNIGSDSTITVAAEEDFEFQFRVKNRFGNSTSLSLPEVVVTMEVEDIEDEETAIANIDPQEEDEESVEITFDSDDADTYDVIVKASGDDEGTGFHGDIFEFKVTIQEAVEEPVDDDEDGVNDDVDDCLGTLPGCDVDSNGCDVDSDDDGLCDGLDQVNNAQKNNQNANQNQQSAPPAAPSAPPQTKKEEVEDKKPKEKEDATSFVPFVIGFVIGAIIAAGCFMLLKSDYGA